jgi:hypothetical protein
MVQTLVSTVEKRRDDVVKMLAGVLDCQDFIRARPQQGAAIISQGMARSIRNMLNSGMDIL